MDRDQSNPAKVVPIRPGGIIPPSNAAQFEAPFGGDIPDAPPALTPEEVELCIELVAISLGEAVERSVAFDEHDQNAIVAEAAFRWLERRTGNPAIVGSMMASIAAMRMPQGPQSPEVA